MDFGIVGTLTEFDKEYLAQNFLAFFRRDYKRVAACTWKAAGCQPPRGWKSWKRPFAPCASRISTGLWREISGYGADAPVSDLAPLSG
ncbi:hypothetical protein J4714_13905 [Staphylococcus epidermidis]|nr:hypothetical protein [Staphylococcus epidermidis]